MSQLIKFILVILALFSLAIFAIPKVPMQLTGLPFKESIKKRVENGDVYSESTVDDFVQNEIKMQKLAFKIAGLHPKECRFALRKLSQYEKFNEYIGFVKLSAYDEKKGRVYFVLSSKLLPYDMALSFNIPRIKKPGVYPFSFDQGFLSGLTGEIHVGEENGKCLFYTEANWQGKSSGIPNSVFEFFSKTLSHKSMELLIQISKVP